MSGDTALFLAVGGAFAVVPAAVLATTIWALRRWSSRRRENPTWRPHPALVAVTWFLIISAGLILLAIGRCTGGLILDGLDWH